MWSWFGGASAQAKKDAPKNAILSLRQQLDMLQKREKYLETQMSDQDAIARKNVTTNKNAAKAALRRKKVHERSLEQTTAQIIQIEQQIYSIEAANINQETLNAMKNAGTAMKQIHSGLTIEKVDETMDQLREQHALSEEIVNAITNAPIGEPLDETELEAELEGMEQEAIDERMLKTGTVPVGDRLDKLPTAANGELKGKSKATEEEDEEAELEKLRAEMAM
ncbi:ESCRT-III subunit protein snf7 [Ophidiomyces ophidiicola]|uniref:ESCRT-III subunit protein snf7 n=1 Tax=Ophidiomyces ophidiicola TaxID=1387563 RepID=A0ACB8V174_9EURO|nr:ESCRT-III subunit protein snf7 [Ophidiomyces ophidiicola]KAI1906065.1 ESCRT-III subunit protein snf7 [Ophidiomyces ophidiicola]KAI1913846.1 ESCRT-III subunit protein snf7 [Ophidiomyces ophidiicola]KAI1916272.1 ESCRT-III subunit protein snf7 [Ophidiomyces ophidiicola]KAI1927914.1 ESCRT-III subunit protein snf7 [Ophidiomyces ophidiicola]KAI1936725.1 ESCRT-III subunit protein snf7 [Ophidiomyces ophidiicola]